MTSANVPDDVRLPEPAVEEVSEGIFGYVQLDGSWGLNNTGFVAGKTAVVAIDTCFTVRRSQAFASAIERTAPGKPVRTLVNTHHHGDHTHGNMVFAPGATIVGHDRCREEVIEAGLGTTAMWPDVEWGEIVVTPASVTFSDRMTVFVDELELHLIYVGPAHTTNDVIVWIPERKVLFTGDVIFNGGTPFALFGSIAGWLDALEVLRGLGAERIVPGHGHVCGPEVIDEVGEYLRFVQEAAKEGFDAGMTPLEAAKDADLGNFGDLLDRERLAGNLHRAYSELRGEARGTAIGVQAAMGDMIAYNGGQMPRCLA
jgi:cyclase